MALSFKVRASFRAFEALRKVGIVPSAERALTWPMDKRFGMGPSKGTLRSAPTVPFYDAQVPTRDGAHVRVRVYTPDGATAPLLYAHGGGFFAGGIVSCDHICRRLAVEAGVVVVSVEYRLAPEHAFPGPLNDVEDALDWVLAQEWDTSRLVVGGDSAGGNLAAALALRLRDRGTPLTGQLLVYPAVDMTGSHTSGYEGIGLNAEETRLCADLYLRGGGDPTDPFASPLLAPDLTGLAPALVVVVEEDPLRAEGIAYAQRLQEAGVPAQLVDVPGHVHGSLSVPQLYDGIDDLYAQMSAFVREPGLVSR